MDDTHRLDIRKSHFPSTAARVPRWLAAPLALVMAFIVLLGALGIGVRVSSFGVLGLLPGFGGLDYARAPLNAIAPLRQGYIRDVLGSIEPQGGLASPDLSDPPANLFLPKGLSRVYDDHPLINDDKADARAVPRVPFTARTDSAKATRESDEWSDCSDVGDTIWYRYAPPSAARLIANTYGTNHAATLGVFEVVGRKRTQNHWCNTNALGNALVPFTARAGSTYLFQVTAVRGAAQFFNLERWGKTTLVAARGQRPSISADGNVIAYLAADPNGEPCLDPPKSPTTGSIFWTYRAVACEQVIVLDRRTGKAVVASVNPQGRTADSRVIDLALSGNGRFVAFSTFADNLVDHDDNVLADIFVHDLVTRRTERASVSSDEEEMRRDDGDVLSSQDARLPSISYDGRYVVFESSASNLVTGDRRGVIGPGTDLFGGANVDVFVRDRIEGTTERVSVSTDGEPADDEAVRQENQWRLENLRTEFAHPCISSNGRFVKFSSLARNFSAVDNNQVAQTFVHDRETGVTDLVSVSSSGAAGDDWSSVNQSGFVGKSGPVWLVMSSGHCVSDDGRFVVFHSWARNLDPDEDGFSSELFVRDRVARRTSDIGWPGYATAEQTTDAVRGTPAGDIENRGEYVGGSQESISRDGRYVSFRSFRKVTEGDGDDQSDVFVFDVRRGSYVRVSVAPSGEEWSDDAIGPAISADARFIAFTLALPGPTGRVVGAIYVHKRRDLG